jgi:hypothetical protein
MIFDFGDKFFIFLLFDKFVDKFFLSIGILQLLNVITVEPEASWNFVDSFHFGRGLVCCEEVWAALCCCCFGVKIGDSFLIWPFPATSVEGTGDVS